MQPDKLQLIVASSLRRLMEHEIPVIQGSLSLTWISNHMSSKVWDEITYPFPNSNGGMDKQFHPTF